MSNVSTVVYTQPNSNDQVDARDHVYCQTPEVDETSHVDHCKHNTAEHQNAGGNVLDEQHSCDEDTQQGSAHVTPGLHSNYLNKHIEDISQFAPIQSKPHQFPSWRIQLQQGMHG